MPLPAQIASATVIVLSVGWCWRQQQALRGLRLHEQGGVWQLVHAGQSPRLLPVCARVWRYLVVLDFVEADTRKRCRVVIFPDSVEVDVFRRLRVRLRYRDMSRDDDV